MQTFKKIFTSAMSIILITVLLSIAVIYPLVHSENSYYQDAKLRRSLAGKIDFLFVGSSHTLCGIDPRVADKELGCFSYDITGPLLPDSGKIALLQKELNRNPVETVVIEVSYDTLTRLEKKEFANGEEVAVLKLDSFRERFDYIVHNVSLDNLLNLYSREFVDGLQYYINRIKHQVENVDYSLKGFLPTEATDFVQEELENDTNNPELISTYTKENIAKLDTLISICQQKGCRTILAITAVSNATLWANPDRADFSNWLKAYAQKKNVEFYDVNLIKTRFDVFKDDVSFQDGGHLSAAGAQENTQILCKLIRNTENGISNNTLLFTDYKQMRQYSPYASNT